MKNKIYKLLSIIVALAVVLSCCVIGFTVSAADEVKATYYLSSNSTAETCDGSVDAPFKTVEEALIYAVKSVKLPYAHSTATAALRLTRIGRARSRDFTSSARRQARLVSTDRAALRSTPRRSVRSAPQSI